MRERFRAHRGHLARGYPVDQDRGTASPRGARSRPDDSRGSVSESLARMSGRRRRTLEGRPASMRERPMTEPTTDQTTEPTTVDEYLARLPDDRREAMSLLRRT